MFDPAWLSQAELSFLSCLSVAYFPDSYGAYRDPHISSSVKPCRHTQRCVSVVILNPVMLTIAINHYILSQKPWQQAFYHAAIALTLFLPENQAAQDMALHQRKSLLSFQSWF